MKILNIEHYTYATSVNCYSGKCRPGKETIIKEKVSVKVEVGGGVIVMVELSTEEIEYFKQIVFTKAKEKLSNLNVEVTNRPE